MVLDRGFWGEADCRYGLKAREGRINETVWKRADSFGLCLSVNEHLPGRGGDENSCG